MMTVSTAGEDIGMDSSSEGGDDAPAPRDLRFLKTLVTVLTATMILGLIAVFAAIVIRFPGTSAPAPLPAAIALPDGVEAEAVTLGRDFIAVVAGHEILIYDRTSGELRQRIAVTPGG
jgi:hypothetical protein